MSFKLIVISPEINVLDETVTVNNLFEEGLETFHLRKPGKKINEIEAYIQKIKGEFHSRIVIHEHFELHNLYELKGYHGNIWNKEIENLKGTKSTSFHSLEEIKNLEKPFNYCFLSPIFNSISKENYSSKFKSEDLKHFFDTNKLKSEVIALGGLSHKNIKLIKNIGFSGAAVLGAIWNDTFSNRIENFRKLNFNER